jgi:cell division protein ZapA (FtsZ GTPase activity inhibitor)
MNTAKKYTIRILQNEYVLLSDEPEAHVAKTAEMVDLSMRTLQEQTLIKDHKKSAVLTALRLASKVTHLEGELDECKKREASLIATIDQILARFTGQ